MKPYIPYSLILAAASCGMAFGAATAYTTPVGYTTNIIKAAYPGGPKNNIMSLPLVNSASWAGTVTSVSGDVLTLNVGASPLVAGAFNNINAKYPGTTVYAYYIESADGYWAQIDVSGTNSVTVEAGAGVNFSDGEAVTIRRHRTVSDLFGPNNEAGLTADPGGDFNVGDNITLIDETNGGNVILMAAPGILGAGVNTYIDTSYNDADDYPIYPDQGMQLLRQVTSDLSVTVTGEVHTKPTQIQITTGIQVRPVVLPTAVALKDLALFTGNIATGLAGSDSGDLNQADGLTIVVNGVTTAYFYSTIDLGLGIGWYDDTYAYVNDNILPAGAALIINRNNPTNSAPFIWVNPAPVIGP